MGGWEGWIWGGDMDGYGHEYMTAATLARTGEPVRLGGCGISISR